MHSTSKSLPNIVDKAESARKIFKIFQSKYRGLGVETDYVHFSWF